MGVRVVTWVLLLLAAATLGFAGDARAATFTCGVPDCPIQITDNPNFPATGDFAATPYPSTISVSGLSGTITKVTVTLTGYTHGFPDDVDVLLVGPTGAAVELMSDAGAGADTQSVDLTFDDAASGLLPDGEGVATGTYKPSNYPHAADDTFDGCVLESPPSAGNTDPFPASAPAAPAGGYSQTLSAFNDTSPNGTWKLFVGEDCSVDSGSLDSWSIDILAAPPTGVTVARFDARARGGLVEVRWRSGAEVGLLGYNVFRMSAGKTTRLNRSLIAARGSSSAGSAYRFLDRTARPGRHIYRLEVVRKDGSRSWYGHAAVRLRR